MPEVNDVMVVVDAPVEANEGPEAPETATHDLSDDVFEIEEIDVVPSESMMAMRC